MTLPCQGRTPYTTLLSNSLQLVSLGPCGAERTCPRRGLSPYSMPHNYRAMKRQLQDDTGQGGFPMRKD
ncbi:unnamed protein product [Ixodes persulcatus]